MIRIPCKVLLGPSDFMLTILASNPKHMRKFICILILCGTLKLFGQSTIEGINFNWRFAKGDQSAAVAVDFDDSEWERVDLPHDWAIRGPFGKLTDHGGQGKLPWRGEGWYRKSFELAATDKGKRVQLIFDGVMASPTVYLNGKKVGAWIYGYNAFVVDATDAARFGEKNILTVHADTREHFSRWYPGAGMYRTMELKLVDPVHIPTWGVFVTTPEVSDSAASVQVEVEVQNTLPTKKNVGVEIALLGPDGQTLAKERTRVEVGSDQLGVVTMQLQVKNPRRWDIEHPHLYTAVSRVVVDGKETHRETTHFGIRTIEWTANDGLHLNGRRVQVQGVNMHHDQGPLGGAFYMRAMERQIEILKEMGVNAIRTSHNPSAKGLLELCDRMGVLVYNELFDKYGNTAGVNCSTADYVNIYAEREVRNFVRRDRNHPCVFTWSIANENGPILKNEDGKAPQHVSKMVAYFKKYDLTRPITMGCNFPWSAKKEKRILDALDTISWNYQEKFIYSRENYPEKGTAFSESASAFGTRGAYKLKLPEHKMDYSKDGECNAYILTAAPWSDIPEVEIDRMRTYPFVIGEFVWSGFDYLGEPTPYIGGRIHPSEDRTEARSSYFGIVDLAGFPKDNYYMYRSYWRPEVDTVHLSPHWNWAGYEGQKVPVILYTNGDEAELFLNGKSLGREKKRTGGVRIKNLAFAKIARASSEQIDQDALGNVQSENFAAKALDGNLKTRWCADSNDVPQTWQVDLGKLQTFSFLKIVWESLAERYSFSLETSSDGLSWNPVTAKQENVGEVCTLSFDQIEARFARIRITAIEGHHWASICEVEILPEAPKETITDEPLYNPYYEIVRRYRICWFDIPYAPGELKAVAYKDGQRIGESIVRTAGEGVALRLTPDRRVIDDDGLDLCYISVDLVDANGVPCPLAMDDLTFEVAGPARLVGVGNGNPMGHDAFTDDTHPLFYGKAMAILRATPGESGIVTLAVTSETGLKAETQIQVGFE
jgi:beta-galactosidase